MTQRTDQQRKALEVYCKLCAEAINNAGLTMQESLKTLMDVEWSQETFKNIVWKAAQKKFLNKDSTTQLEKHEIDEVYDHVNRWLAKLGVDSIPFPTDEKRIGNYDVILDK